jgi:cation-transporting ATPase I
MSFAPEELRLIHALPGRVRLHFQAWHGGGRRTLETQLRRIPGVLSARANPLTANALIRFDTAVTDTEAIIAAARELDLGALDAPGGDPATSPVQYERHGRAGRARIAVSGVDRDPKLANRVVECLERHRGVQASACHLTGRVLVEFSEDTVPLEQLVAEVAELELEAVPGERRPASPLAPGTLLGSAVLTTGAAIGLSVVVASRVFRFNAPLDGTTIPAVIAGAIGILEGFTATRSPPSSEALEPSASDLAIDLAAIISLTFAKSPLGLLVHCAAALHLLTETRHRRAAWRRYEQRLVSGPSARQGEVIRLEAGDRAPQTAEVMKGTGTATGGDGLPVPVTPGCVIGAGTRLFGGPFELELRSGEPFRPKPRPAPIAASLYDRYRQSIGPLSLAYAAATALTTRSLPRTFTALLLLSPRTATIGGEAASLGASERVLRSGVTVVGTRPERIVRRPSSLLLDGPRMLTDGHEVATVLPLAETRDASEILMLSAGVAAAAGSPWGSAFPATSHVPADDGTFDGRVATARSGKAMYSLGPVDDPDMLAEEARLYPGSHWLALWSDSEERPIGILALRPRLAAGVIELVQECRRHRVEVGMLLRGDTVAAQAIGDRAEVPLMTTGDALEAVRSRQREGGVVAYASDNADAAAAFAACDLAIGVTAERTRFAARADLIAPDLSGVAATIVAGARREATVRDSVALAVLSNLIGAVWGFRGRPDVAHASKAVHVTALAAMGVGWARLSGGKRPLLTVSALVDPRPEQWGRRSLASVMRTFDTGEEGLTSAQARERQRTVQPQARHGGILEAVLEQVWSPLTGILSAGAALSLSLGAITDATMVGAMIIANAAVGVWQERQVNRAAEALERLVSVTARVLRDGRPVELPANEIVPGDVLLLAAGDLVAADARLFENSGLEVDEAALTGESLPVMKSANGGTDASRVVLEGSAVTVGTGRAVVVATGRNTRMGAVAEALAHDEEPPSPLSAHLNQMLRQVLPLIAAGGAIVTASGLLRRQPLLPQLAMGASIAVAAVPEGLPILAKVGEAAVSRRLARRHALVRRLSAIEGLGRVDVVCTDKTGTLTEGRLALRLVADIDQEARLPTELPKSLRRVLLTAALAGPHPDEPDAGRDPTDAAVARAGEEAGLGRELRARREAKHPFSSAQSFHATVVQGRLCIEGSAEALAFRCDRVRRHLKEQPLDEAGRQELLAHTERLAERGLRVLMVAEGPPEAQIDDPHGLVALGFLGISDPIRTTVRAAVRRFHDAGGRVIMLTGDHPATARVIASEAGLPGHDSDILTGTEMADLRDDELDQRLSLATVIARATPLDKLRIVESLKRLGHTVAMTGDGVNDAPALRLADIGVAMGRSGTEVARQAADVVLADDDFSTLVETLVEGRSFWRNIRRALGLLLGGNLGELGLEIGASVLGVGSPLNTRQILAMNLITDVFPALAVAFQQPEHRNLAALAREGESALGSRLRNAILRRATATAMPTLVAYLVALRSGSVPLARTVAFTGIVTTQLAQTLDIGWAEDGLNTSVLAAVAGSAGLLASAFSLRPIRDFLGLAVPSSFGWGLIGTGTLAAVLLGRSRSLPGAAHDVAPRPRHSVA